MWLKVLVLPLPIAVTCRLGNTRGYGKIELYTCMHMSALSKRPEYSKEESVTLVALTVEGNYVIDFCLERDSYDSGQSEVFSTLLDGRPHHKRTYAINDPFQLNWSVRACAMVCAYKSTYERIVPFRFTL